MRKANSYHPEFAAQRVCQGEKWGHDEMTTAASLVSTYEVRPLLQALAAEIGSDKLAGIAASVAEIEDQREAQGRRCYRKVTDAQRHALAAALLEKYGTARNIVKAAWGLTDAQIDESDA